MKGDVMSFPRFVAAIAACILLGASLSAQALEDRQPGVDGLRIESSRVTGLASLLTGPAGAPIPGIEDRHNPLAIFDLHGRIFGISDANSELRRLSTALCDLGNVHHRYQQVYRGIDVFTGQLIVHQDPQGNFLAVNGDFYPLRSGVATKPRFTLEEAIFLAAGELKIEAPQTLEEKLVIVDPGWYGDPSDQTVHLAWHMVVGSVDSLPEHVLIDAIDGSLLDHWPAVHTAINRQIYDGSGGGLPGILTRTEGGAPTGDANVDSIYDFTGDFYQLLSAGLNRDSLNGSGNALVATANWNDGICPNAIWNGSGTAFCNGLGTDDIVGHEFGHGLTDYTADLIYQNQSGQLNESFSDVFGELVDLWNGNASIAGTPGGTSWPPTPTGSGTDTPNSGRTGCGDSSVRWLMGEDSSLGAIRDMWSPQCMGDPPSALDPLYEATSCDPGFDGGGVHFGSGVPNHAFAMVTDGKSFNGQTVTGIGLIKSGAVWFRTLTVYLTPGSDFNEAYTLFNQAASDLVGTTPNDPRTGGSSGSVFTSDDAVQVQNALTAVEMNAAGICSPPPPPDNDDCIEATVVAAGISPINNSGGTDSGVGFDETQCSGTFLGQVAKDIWLSYTPAQNGTATFTTCNIASWDTDVLIYTGSCGSLNQIACNGDASGCSNFTSTISNLAVTGGTNYLIRIGSFGSSGGSGEIDIIFTPGGGTPIEVCNNGVDDDGDGAIDCADADCAADPACTSTPAEDCSNGVDDDGDGAVDCADPDCAGDPACVATADGDECVDAIIALLGANPVNTVGATNSTELSDPAQCSGTFLGGFFQDIWYSFTPASDGLLTLSLCNSVDFDTDVAIYIGGCGGLDQIGCNGDGSGCAGFTSLLSDVPVTAGIEYKIRIGGWNASANGTGTLDLTLVSGTTENCTNGVDDDLDGLTDCEDPDCSADPACIPFPADECNTAIAVSLGSNAVDTSGATDSADAVGPCSGSFIGTMSQDVWYSYQPPSNGILIISTCGSLSFDSSLIVYQGNCGALTQVACDGDSCGLASEVMLNVNGAEQLKIRLGAASAGVGGIGTLQIDMVLPTPEDCSNGIDDDLDSLVDCLDPDCAADPACTCDPITALTCIQGIGLEVTLGWTNGESYDQIQVTRDGSLVANLPGTASNYTDPSASLGPRTYVVTGFCGGSQSSALCDVQVQMPAGYLFVAPQVIGEFDELSGVGSVEVAVSIGEETNNPGFPNDTQGFSMSLAHDPSVLVSVSLAAAPALAGMNGSSGPDFMTETMLPGGITVGVVYSFAGQETLAFSNQTEVLIIGYDTNAAAIAGSTVAVASALQWTSTIGTSSVDNLVVVGGAAYAPDPIDGVVVLTPVAAGGFDRGDCNVDGSFDIADIIHSLNGLFVGGSFSCVDACDINDDGLVNVADPVYGLGSQFSGGPLPPAPHGACGADPTADSLDCVLYDSCS
jgi:Zn-dependent metalloprotease